MESFRLFLDEKFGSTPVALGETLSPLMWHILPWIAVTVYYLMVRFLPGILSKQRSTPVRKTTRDSKEPIPKTPAKGTSFESKPVRKTGRRKFSELSFLEWIMFFHNIILCVFSGSVFFVSLTQHILVHLPKAGGWFVLVCDQGGKIAQQPFFTHTVAFMFAWSKYYELIDTLLLIIKKPERKVNFLHWYHHITVLLFTWYTFKYQITCGYIFGIVNVFVHSIMYFYYAIVLIGIRPKWDIMITVIQILQMFFGLFILCLFFYYYITDHGCSCAKGVWLFFTYGFLMYGSYLFLFLKFFAARYLFKGKSKRN